MTTTDTRPEFEAQFTSTTRRCATSCLFTGYDYQSRDYAAATKIMVAKITKALDDQSRKTSKLNAMLGRVLASKADSDLAEELQMVLAYFSPQVAMIVTYILRRQNRGIREADVFAWGGIIRFELEQIKEWGEERLQRLQEHHHDRYGWQITPVEMMRVAVNDLRTRRGYKLSRFGEGFFEPIEDEFYDDYERDVQIPTLEGEGGICID